MANNYPEIFSSKEEIETIFKNMKLNSETQNDPGNALFACFDRFKEITKNTMIYLDNQVKSLQKLNESYIQENKKLNDDINNFKDDLLKKEQVDHDSSKKMKELRSKFKEEIIKMKTFTMHRKNAGEKMNQLADDCIAQLNLKKVEFDEIKAQTDYENELYTKLHEKLVLISTKINQKK